MEKVPSLIKMESELEKYESSQKSKLQILENEIEDQIASKKSNLCNVTEEKKKLNGELQNNDKELLDLKKEIQAKTGSDSSDLFSYLERKEKYEYLRQKEMISYMEKRDMLRYLEQKEMLQYLQKKKSESNTEQKRTEEDKNTENKTKECEKNEIHLPAPEKKKDIIYQNLIIPFKHIPIESFDKQDEFEESSNEKHDLYIYKEKLVQMTKDEQNDAYVDTLSFMGNSYSSQFFEEIKPYLKKLKGINKVVLNDCFTNRKDDLVLSLTHLMEGIENKGVFAIDLSNNAIGKNGCEALFNFFQTNKKLEYLYAENIGLSQSAVPVFCNALIQGKPPLKVLTLNRNKIEESVVKIAELVETLPLLEEFSIFANTIHDKFMVRLLDGFANHKNLKNQDIHDNYVDTEAFPSLLYIIKNSESQESQNISDSNFEEEMNDELIEALKVSKCKWKEFSHNYNEFFLEKHFELVEQLEKSGNLVFLSLLGSDIYEEKDAQYLLTKLRNANGNKKTKLIWDEETEQDLYLNETEDSDFKKVIKKFIKKVVQL